MKRLLIALAILVSMRASAAASADATALFQRARDAAGGVAWDDIGALRAEGEENVIGLTGRWQGIDDVRGGRYVQRSDLGVFRTSEGFDGHEHWRQDRSGGVHRIDSRFAHQATATDAWLARRGWLRSDVGGAALQAPHDDTLDGKTYSVVTATPKNGQAVELWFDPSTALLARSVRQMPTSLQVVSYGDYRDVERVKLPFSVATGDGSPDNDDVVHMLQYEIVKKANAADFARAVPPRDATVPPNGTTIPLEIDGYVIVDAKLNGQSYAFILDTGGHDIITPEVAKALKLSAVGTGASGGAGEGTIAEQDARVAKLELGEAVMTDQHFFVIPLQYRTVERGARPPLGGILGLEIFERFATRLDYRAKTLTLRPKEFQYKGKGKPVPITFADDMPLVDATFEDAPGVFAIDTGNGGTMLVQHVWAEQNGLAARMKAGLETVSYGAGGASRNWASRGTRFDIAGAKLDDVIARYAEDKAGSFSSRTEAGNIGTEILAHFAIDFDYARGVAYFERVPGFTPEPYNRSGLSASKDVDASAFVVAVVGDKTPASEAGIAKDDAIVAVDGVPAAQLSGSAFGHKLRQAPGTRVGLRVKRGDRERDVTLTLREVLLPPKR